MTLLRDLNFVNLFIGQDFADISAGAGAFAPRRPVDEVYREEIDHIRSSVSKVLTEIDDEECSIEHDGVIYRCTRMQELRGKPVLFLRRMTAELRSIMELGLPSAVLNHVLDPNTRGMILVCGDVGSGKTTTAASLIVERVARHGKFGLALEQPPEYEINGEHGNGRLIQVPVTRRNGGFKRQLELSKRTSTSELMIGEIRCEETGAVAVTQANIGTTVTGTIHSKGVVEAISQLETFSRQGGIRDPLSLIARGLSCIIHQEVSWVGPGCGTMLMAFNCLTLGRDSTSESIRQKISDPNRLQQIQQDIYNQRQASR